MAVVRGALAVLGVLLCLVGAVFVGQGTNVIHGSSMSGHGGYAGLGAVLLVIGLGLLIVAWRTRRRRHA
jgi:protein-S-isoprenylcysteine O-methyltransferase Ste14